MQFFRTSIPSNPAPNEEDEEEVDGLGFTAEQVRVARESEQFAQSLHNKKWQAWTDSDFEEDEDEPEEHGPADPSSDSAADPSAAAAAVSMAVDEDDEEEEEIEEEDEQRVQDKIDCAADVSTPSFSQLALAEARAHLQAARQRVAALQGKDPSEVKVVDGYEADQLVDDDEEEEEAEDLDEEEEQDIDMAVGAEQKDSGQAEEEEDEEDDDESEAEREAADAELARIDFEMNVLENILDEFDVSVLRLCNSFKAYDQLTASITNEVAAPSASKSLVESWVLHRRRYHDIIERMRPRVTSLNQAAASSSDANQPVTTISEVEAMLTQIRAALLDISTVTSSATSQYRDFVGLQDIVDDQKGIGRSFCLNEKNFALLCNEIAQDYRSGNVFSSEAFEALQLATEEHLMDMLRQSSEQSVRAGRQTICPKDIQLARRQTDGGSAYPYIHACLLPKGPRGNDSELDQLVRPEKDEYEDEEEDQPRPQREVVQARRRSSGSDHGQAKRRAASGSDEEGDEAFESDEKEGEKVAEFTNEDDISAAAATVSSSERSYFPASKEQTRLCAPRYPRPPSPNPVNAVVHNRNAIAADVVRKQNTLDLGF